MSKGLCFCCLGKGHSAKECKRKRICGKTDCRKTHHVLLHKDLIENEAQQVATIQTDTKKETSSTLFKVLPVELKGPNGRIIKSYAFVDEGSSTTLMKESLAKELGIVGPKTKLKLQWFGGKCSTEESICLTIGIKAYNGGQKWHEMNVKTIPRLDLQVQSINLSELSEKYPKLRSINLKEYSDADPQILIGLDNCDLTTSLESIHCDKNIIASRTLLGWLLYGKFNMNEETVYSMSCTAMVLHTREDEDDLKKLMDDYFSVEGFGVKLTSKALESKDIERARMILEASTKRINERFETGLLWRSDQVEMMNNKQMAISRLLSLERKMRFDETFKERYNTALQDMVDKGYARKLSDQEAESFSNKTWYLPHFPVFNPNKPNKLRIVFDAAASVGEKSLNSMLLKGPDLNPPLLGLLFKFREKRIGICADIKEMFLQVKINSPDTDAQRFLWRSEEKIETYVMTSMIFGATCSPCSAQFVKNKNAIELVEDPEILEAITEGHYVDDFVKSFENEDKAMKISQQVKEVHMKAGFELRGFISNNKRVQDYLQGIDKETEEPKKEIMVNMSTETTVEKVLGLFWRNVDDKLIFRLNMHKMDPEILSTRKCPTKREFLRLIMAVYDPFGMIANWMIYAKILLQHIWRYGIKWDEVIPESIFKKFKYWITHFKSIENLKVDRFYSKLLSEPTVKLELHVFVDASEDAFAAVAYWRLEYKDQIELSFVCSKTRCAPLKTMTIPRLELQAAVLGTRMKKMIIENHNLRPEKCVMWSDSKTVVSWIKSQHHKYKVFVANRINEILESTSQNDWRWIPTKLNIADLATKCKLPKENKMNWLEGPEFLRGSERSWPKDTKAEDPTEVTEVTEICLFNTEVNQFIKFENYSSFIKLARVIAWMLRPLINLRRKHKNMELHKNGISVEELTYAKKVLCRLAQREVYSNEIEQLQQHGQIEKSSSIFKLTPALNEDNLLCVQGRLDYALALPEHTRRPTILPNRHALTDMIIMWYHQELFHQNDELTVNEIRRSYWIPHLRSAVKRIRQKLCQFCKNNSALPKPVMMGQLPHDRVTPFVRPFTYTGLDYFGPLYVSIGRRREKRWVAIFTCLTIRAVHLELAADLSTDSCILCIRNFVNRRGVPMKIRSDMGTNFVGTDRIIQKTNDLFDMNYIKEELAVKNIHWEFNCPGNPSSGGCWERLVKSVKRVLAVTLKEVAPQVETLRSLLIEAENILNSRPLTHLPISPDEPDPLTPNHFLLGTTNSTQTPGDESHTVSRKQYKISQHLKDMFWKRWIKEYLPTLTKRTKWFKTENKVKVGDVVLICDGELPRSFWKRGIITSLFPAKDGQVRIVEVQTANGKLKRPVSKLAVLDIYGEIHADVHEGGSVAEIV